MANGPGAMINSRRCAGAAASLAALALTATAAAPASAAAPVPARQTFALSPVGSTGALLLHGEPGGVLHGAVLVRNLTGRAVSVVLKRADIRNASNGNADYVTTRPSRTGSWLQLAARTVRLAPHAARRIAFVVSVPTGTRGASHYGGIVAVDAAELAAVAAGRTSRRKNFSFYRVSRQALPVTVRLPGVLSRSIALRSARLSVEPVGASLVLGLLPGGSELIRSTRIDLRVMRDGRTTFRSTSTLGQLFPDAPLNYRIPWRGRPTEGSYRVVGMIRPDRAAAVKIDETVRFSPAGAAQLEHETPPSGPAPSSDMPIWVWIALAAGGSLLAVLSIAVWKLARRPAAPVA
jgi:hypothetical protein